MEQVEKGLADLGLIFFAEPSKSQMVQELRSKGMIFNHMAYQRAHVYLWEGHPLAGQKEICLESLVDYPFITYDRVVNANPAYTELVVPYYMIHKTISVSDRAAAYSIMRCSQGFAGGERLPFSGSGLQRYTAIPIENGVSLEIGWILRSSYVLPEAAERFHWDDGRTGDTSKYNLRDIRKSGGFPSLFSIYRFSTGYGMIFFITYDPFGGQTRRGRGMLYGTDKGRW